MNSGQQFLNLALILWIIVQFIAENVSNKMMGMNGFNLQLSTEHKSSITIFIEFLLELIPIDILKL